MYTGGRWNPEMKGSWFWSAEAATTGTEATAAKAYETSRVYIATLGGYIPAVWNNVEGGEGKPTKSSAKLSVQGASFSKEEERRFFRRTFRFSFLARILSLPVQNGMGHENKKRIASARKQMSTLKRRVEIFADYPTADDHRSLYQPPDKRCVRAEFVNFSRFSIIALAR